ncbi:triose-phosphate transporter family-domain-containing protein [Dioszegia hungarica]|uniref:Triose-phosphate transporter family-domain-containing protein n=1 Tax=Dioszegia hungarica TaxID=4972 RepID=A0AA38HAJ5_9TREE|nr:triose-phosphate transporter family-domain-containing protein [Dioszegia hungarica]KAI9636500.1 triose-phosphate transporter family-domain-containing protein [Dioszegia hungarica]
MSDPRQRAPFARLASYATGPVLSEPKSAHRSDYPSGYETPPRVSSPAPNPFAIPTLTVPKADTVRFVALCILWYGSSALSSNTGKVIMTSFRFPVTMTIIQFFFVAGYCIIISKLGWATRLRTVNWTHVRSTLPMAGFQVGGHIFSSLAISRVPVSTVHTIKALSPLFTVLAYAVLFSVSYSPATYISLLPLTFGVMLACSSDMAASNIFGLICAFGSTLIFVSQNIFFKKVMPTNAEASQHGKLDRINLLYFSSGLAFFLMIPVWIYSDFWRLWSYTNSSAKSDSTLVIYFFLNGTVHFAQNLLAFAILSSTSPVTYSIASLVKRIAVICLAIIWFKQSVHALQGVGIGLTAVGLWMYNNSKRDVEKGEKRMRQVEASRDGILPQNLAEAGALLGDGSRKESHSPAPFYPSSLPPSSILHSGYQHPGPLPPGPHSEKSRPSPPPSAPPQDSTSSRLRRLSNDPPTTAEPIRFPRVEVYMSQSSPSGPPVVRSDIRPAHASRTSEGGSTRYTRPSRPPASSIDPTRPDPHYST